MLLITGKQHSKKERKKEPGFLRLLRDYLLLLVVGWESRWLNLKGVGVSLCDWQIVTLAGVATSCCIWLLYSSHHMLPLSTNFSFSSSLSFCKVFLPVNSQLPLSFDSNGNKNQQDLFLFLSSSCHSFSLPLPLAILFLFFVPHFPQQSFSLLTSLSLTLVNLRSVLWT